MTPELARIFALFRLLARLTRGVDGYQQLGQPDRNGGSTAPFAAECQSILDNG